MSTVSELVQANFKLTAELKQIRNELATLRAEREMEDSAEVVRIKQAYEELEKEVVSLRMKNLVQPDLVADVVQLPSVESAGVIAMLSDQLERERQRSNELEERIMEFKRRETDSDQSTCVGSPFYRELSSQTFSGIQVNPVLEELFKPSAGVPRRVALIQEPLADQSLKTVKRTVPTSSSGKKDAAVQRLSKIARFKQ